MSDVRKAVITTAQVQEALASYLKIRKENGVDDGALEFDKGARGKGFATYKGNEVVTSFDTKEEAYVYYGKWVEVAQEVLKMVTDNPKATEGAKKLIKATDKPDA